MKLRISQRKHSMLLLALLTALTLSTSYGGQITLQGHAPSYRGKVINIYKHLTPITARLSLLDAVVVQTNGSFSKTINIDDAMPIFFLLGSTIGRLYVQPQGSYDIILPTYRPLTNADANNPNFQPYQIILTVKGEGNNGTNTNLNMMNHRWDELISEFAASGILRTDSSFMDTLEGRMDKTHWNETVHQEFEFLKGYTEANIRPNMQRIAGEYFDKNPVFFHHFEYTRLFNKVFGKLSHRMKAGEERKFAQAISSQNVDTLNSYLKNYLKISSNEVVELVGIRASYDAYFNRNYKSFALPLLEEYELGTSNKKVREVCQSLMERIEKQRTKEEKIAGANSSDPFSKEGTVAPNAPSNRRANTLQVPSFLAQTTPPPKEKTSDHYKDVGIAPWNGSKVAARSKPIQRKSFFADKKRKPRPKPTPDKTATPRPPVHYIYKGEAHSLLGKYKGYYLYIGFLNARNLAGRRDMFGLKELRSTTSPNVYFLTVYMNREPATLKMPEISGNWDVTHYSKHPELVRDFEVEATPAFFLLSPEGKILHSPAKGPLEGINEDFKKAGL